MPYRNRHGRTRKNYNRRMNNLPEPILFNFIIMYEHANNFNVYHYPIE